MSFGTEPRWPRPARRTLGLALGAAWLFVAVAALCELFLVGYAERRLTRSLQDAADGVSVQIDARPAVALLAGRADDVVVRVGTLRPRAARRGPAGDDLGDLLAKTGATAHLDARIDTLVSRRLTLRDVHLVKTGDRLSASATATDRAIRAALPGNITLSAGSGTNALALTATVRALGRRVKARATASASGGRLVIAPKLRGITVLTLTLFDDPRVAIDDVHARRMRGGYTVEASGHLR